MGEAGEGPGRRLTRRGFVRDAGMAAAAVGLAGPLAAPAIGAARGRRVAVLGGGMAGLTVAHELVERGFKVDVYEPVALGGKARSIDVPGPGKGGRRPLPGEHGFRFFPGFYHHVPDSMRRTPDGKNANGVWDNLVDTSEGRSVRANGRADAQLFGMVPDPVAALTPQGLQALLLEEIVKMKMVPPHEAGYLATRLAVFLTSCEERRFGQWEHVAWWDYIGAASRSDEYQKVAARGLTRSLVAAKETVASTRTIGNMAEAFIMNIMQRGNDGALDRVLDAPTNEAWISPWVRLLRGHGVRFHMGQEAVALDVRGGRVRSAVVRDRRGRRRRVQADWFVSAMPAERIRRLLSRPLLKADPSLEGIRDLQTDWMAGIQYYLTRKVDITHGHVTYVDSPWALTSLTQAQFWGERDFARDYGDGRSVDCLSVDISDWDSPGLLVKKKAKRCTPAEIRREVWHQITEHLKDTDPSVLGKGLAHKAFLDPGIRWDRRRRRNSNATPLLVNTAGSWDKRPQAHTRVGNLFLSGDYVQTDIDLATMEGANESGRAAAGALLDAAGSGAAPPRMYKLYDPPEFEAFKRADKVLYDLGRPNVLDVG
ncbi:MAG TPA: FAD-dependent oxidoreductase [Thermoleophilaceae bacterium]|nr:FAD-dependent oxidoreductase [Thermoleophilaceae bacterium]